MSEENTAFAENPERAHRILNAAVRLISHYGYDKTTVSDIAKEAGVSKGAIYLHWKSKEDLFNDLLNREMNLYVERWLQLMDEDPGEGTFSGMYRNSLKVIDESLFMQAIFKRDTRILGSYARQDDFQRDRLKTRLEFVKLMQDVDAIRGDIKAEVIAHVLNIIGVGFVFIRDFIDEDQIPPLEEVLMAIGIMLDSALTPTGGTHSEKTKEIIRQLMNIERQQVEDKNDNET